MEAVVGREWPAAASFRSRLEQFQTGCGGPRAGGDPADVASPGGAGNVPPDLPLVFSTIRFCGLNHHRSESRRRKREESVIYLNDFQDVWLDPVLEEDEEALILREAVKNLSQKLREVVVMKFWGGLTFLQISETLAISPNTAASRYRYALEQLAHELRRVKEDRHASA